MTNIAIIGADGAGKTTIAKMLESAYPDEVKYLYLGASIESGDYRLPTSSLILYLKLRSYKKKAKRKGITDPSYISTHHNEHRNVEYGRVGSVLRLINRLLEGYYRQFIAWRFQLQGYTIVCDRDLFIDSMINRHSRRRLDRLYIWILKHFFPKPHLVIFLDAPAETLLARKGEGTVAWLEEWREAYLAAGEMLPNFVTVDASQELESVYADVDRRIAKALALEMPPQYTANV